MQFVYKPELLPSGSWLKILDTLQDHFGKTAEIDDDSKRGISDYLKSNGPKIVLQSEQVRLCEVWGINPRCESPIFSLISKTIESGGPNSLGRIANWRGVTLSAQAHQLTS